MCGQRKRRYAVGMTAPPPHCFLVRGVICGNDMSWTCRGNFRRLRREPKPATHRNHVLKAEGNLNPHLPQLCLYSQFSFALGDMVLQFVGFGIGEAACWGLVFGLVDLRRLVFLLGWFGFLYAIFV